MLAVAAECAVHKLECALVNAYACDGCVGFCAFGNGVSDDVFVFVDDAALDALETGEASVRFQRIPENTTECVASRCVF